MHPGSAIAQEMMRITVAYRTCHGAKTNSKPSHCAPTIAVQLLNPTRVPVRKRIYLFLLPVLPVLPPRNICKAEYLIQRSRSLELEPINKSSRVYTIRATILTPSLSADILRNVLCSENEPRAASHKRHCDCENRQYIPGEALTQAAYSFHQSRPC